MLRQTQNPLIINARFDCCHTVNIEQCLAWDWYGLRPMTDPFSTNPFWNSNWISLNYWFCERSVKLQYLDQARVLGLLIRHELNRAGPYLQSLKNDCIA